MSVQKNIGLNNAYKLFQELNFPKALEILTDAYSNDLENTEIVFAMKCANFWIPCIDQITSLSSNFEKGESFIAHWKKFTNQLGKESQNYEQTLYALRKGIFTNTLERYKDLLKETGQLQKNEGVARMGLCHKKLGDYETALKFYCDAIQKNPNAADILAEMADCYALAGEEKTAKVLFREAFFLNPQQIDIQLLESELICRLHNKISSLGYTGEALQEWLPVYGVLYGVFNIKRILRAFEVAKLKQSIFTLESELKDVDGDINLLIPRLINRYFWLIDHYSSDKDERSKINETLLKIKLLDKDIYTQYTI